MEKRFYLLLSVLLHFSTTIPGVNPTFHKGKCQQRWAKFRYTQAQLESNRNKQGHLFKQATQCTLASNALFNTVAIRFPDSKNQLQYNEQLLEEIKQNEINYKSKNYTKVSKIAHQASLIKIMGQGYFAQSETKAKRLKTLETQQYTPRSRISFLKKLQNNEETIQELKEQKELLLETARRYFYDAIDQYLHAFKLSQDEAQREYCKAQANKIVEKHIHALEVKQVAESPIFTISQEKTELLKKLYT